MTCCSVTTFTFLCKSLAVFLVRGGIVKHDLSGAREVLLCWQPWIWRKIVDRLGESFTSSEWERRVETIRNEREKGSDSSNNNNNKKKQRAATGGIINGNKAIKRRPRCESDQVKQRQLLSKENKTETAEE